MLFRSIVLTLVLALSLAPDAARAADQAPFEINVVVSQTGPAAFIGASDEDAWHPRDGRQ